LEEEKKGEESWLDFFYLGIGGGKWENFFYSVCAPYKFKRYMPQEGGSKEWAGLKMYMTFHWLHVPQFRRN